jgi:hypothetical protein
MKTIDSLCQIPLIVRCEEMSDFTVENDAKEENFLSFNNADHNLVAAYRVK